MTKPINKILPEDVEQFKFLAEHSGEFDSLNRYQQIAVQSAIYPGQGTPFGAMYCALGLGEAGEVQNKVKKMFRDDDIIGIKTHARNSTSGIRRSIQVTHILEIPAERKAAIIKEMGGNLWYLAALAEELGTTLSEVAIANLTELCGRGERNTLSGDGDDR